MPHNEIIRIKPSILIMRQLNKTRIGMRVEAKQKSKSFSIIDFCKSSWWTVLFCLLSFVLYSQAMHKKSLDCFDLKYRIDELHATRDIVSKLNEELSLQISSQTDPAWIELTLMKQLGVVPEGQKKVYFKKDE